MRPAPPVYSETACAWGSLAFRVRTMIATTRRGALLGGIGLAAGASALRAAEPRGATIVSTWDFGAAANAAAFERLRSGGSLLDAIEAGARVPEADPANHSV